MIDFQKMFNIAARKIVTKIMLIAARAKVYAVDDGGVRQTMGLNILKDEIRGDVERVAEYGLASNPPAGSDAIILCPGGDRAMGIVIATENRQYRLKNLASGEVAIYTDEGDYVHFKRGRTIAVSTINIVAEATGAATIKSPLITLDGNVVITGNATAANVTAVNQINDGLGSMADLRNIYNPHTHKDDEGRDTGISTSTIVATMLYSRNGIKIQFGYSVMDLPTSASTAAYVSFLDEFSTPPIVVATDFTPLGTGFGPVVIAAVETTRFGMQSFTGVSHRQSWVAIGI